MNKRLRLRGYVIPTLCILLIGAIAYSGYMVWNIVEESTPQEIKPNYINKSTEEKIYPTISVQNTIIKPFDNESIEKTIPFYNMSDDDQKQQSALIYYENIYMQNTGIMYTSDNEFNVIAPIEGTVKSIREDEIMGKIVEIEHNPNLITIYQSIDSINVSVNQKLIQGEVIGVSAKNKIIDNKYCLHFEVYKNGQLIDPEFFYNLSLEELNE